MSAGLRGLLEPQLHTEEARTGRCNWQKVFRMLLPNLQSASMASVELAFGFGGFGGFCGFWFVWLLWL